jgi:hypothetical protein
MAFGNGGRPTFFIATQYMISTNDLPGSASGLARYPERIGGGLSQPTHLPTAVWISKPQQPKKEPCMPAFAH